MITRLLAVSLLILSGLYAHSQEIVRNLGFEQIDPRGQLLSWTAGNTKEAYLISLDTSVSRSGNVSLSVASLSDVIADRGVGGAENIIFAPGLHTKGSVKVSAYVKTKGMTDGFAAIAMRLNGDDAPIAQINSGSKSKTGDNDWSLVEIELPLVPAVKSLSFALQVSGRGQAWFDDFEISVNGKTIASSTYEDKENFNNPMGHTRSGAPQSQKH
jgi:hypothetical protein